jgi:sulfatase maturation enzyme AslB (radical SAM superfamily)
MTVAARRAADHNESSARTLQQGGSAGNMSIEVRPFGVRCNIRCQYCYQNPERDAGNELNSYDMDKIMSALQKERRDFVLFGGEPLMMPYHDLEALWSYGLQRHGKRHPDQRHAHRRAAHCCLRSRSASDRWTDRTT